MARTVGAADMTLGPYTARRSVRQAYSHLGPVHRAEVLTPSLLAPWARTTRRGPYAKLTRTLGPYNAPRSLRQAYFDLGPVHRAEVLTPSLLGPWARTRRAGPYAKVVWCTNASPARHGDLAQSNSKFVRRIDFSINTCASLCVRLRFDVEIVFPL